MSTELGAQFQAAFDFTLDDYRRMLDKEWAVGITRPFVHGYAAQPADAPWPTASRFMDYVAESWNAQHFPEWQHWSALADYWARGTVVLETGVPRTDVAVYRDGFLTTAARGVFDVTEDYTAPRSLFDGDPLERAGYTIQFIDPDGFVDADPAERGTLFDDGPQYRAVILDRTESLPAPVAESLADRAEHGLAVLVVGQPPERDTGYADPEHGNDRVRDAMERVRASGRSVFVTRTADLPDALERLGVVPRAKTSGNPLLTQWRDAGEKCYLLVYNPTSGPTLDRISVEGSAGVAELHLWTGRTTPIPVDVVGDRSEIAVGLPPLGLRVFEMDRGRPGPRSRTTDPIESLAWTIAGPWDLDVRAETPHGARRVRLTDRPLQDWRAVPELEHLSGACRYTTVVDARSPRLLDLGELAGSARVMVDGHDLGVVIGSDAVLDLTDVPTTATGRLTIEIEVRTALRNAVVASGLRPNAGTVTQAQGLIGPVRVGSAPSDPTDRKAPMRHEPHAGHAVVGSP